MVEKFNALAEKYQLKNKAINAASNVANVVQKGFNKAFGGNKTAWGTEEEKRTGEVFNLTEEEKKEIEGKKKESANPLLYKTTEEKKEQNQIQKQQEKDQFKQVKVTGTNGIEQQGENTWKEVVEDINKAKGITTAEASEQESGMWGDVVKKTLEDLSETKARDLKRFIPKIGGAALLGGKQGLEKMGQYYSETVPQNTDQGRWGEGVSYVERQKELVKDRALRENINNVKNEDIGKSPFQIWSEADQREIDKIIEDAPNETLRKIAEQAPSFGSSTTGGALGFIGGPVASYAYFLGSSGQSYYEDAKRRGMNDDDAYLYSGIMGNWEGISDSMITAQNVNFLKSKISGSELSGGVMKLIGNQFVENAFQEGITDPISELAIGLTGGKEYMQTDDLMGRMLDSAFWGGIQGALSGGFTGITADSFSTAQEAENYLADKIQKAIEKRGREKFAKDFIKAANDNMSRAAVKLAKDEINASQFTEKQRTEIMRFINKSDSNVDAIKKSILVLQRLNELNESIYTSARGRATAETWQQGIIRRAENSKNGIENTDSTETPQTQERYTRLLENNAKQEEVNQNTITETKNVSLKNVDENIQKIALGVAEERAKEQLEQNEQFKKRGNLTLGNYTINYTINENGKAKITKVVENVETTEKQPSTMENKQLLENNQQTIQEEGKTAENATSQEISEISKKSKDVAVPIDMDDSERVEKANQKLLKAKKQEENKTTAKLTPKELERKNEILETIGKTEEEWNKMSQYGKERTLDNFSLDEITDEDRSLMLKEDEQTKNKLLQANQADLDAEAELESQLLSDEETESRIKTAADPEMQEILNDIEANSIQNTMAEDATTEEQEALEAQAGNDISLLTNSNTGELGETYSLKDNITKSVRTMSKKELSDHTTRIVRKPVRQVTRQERATALLWAAVVDKGAVFEDMDFRTKDINNKKAQSAYQRLLNANQEAYYAIAKGHYVFENGERVKVSDSLMDLIDEVGENRDLFSDYMYSLHNIDRMSLEERAKEKAKVLEGDLKTLEETYKKNPPESEDEKKEYQKQRRKLQSKIDYLNNEVKNKAVREIKGEIETAEQSKERVAQIEAEHPEFVQLAEKVYKFLDANNLHLKNAGILSDDRIALFKELYPHYVPIDRLEYINGEPISVPLDRYRTTDNNPIHRSRKEGGTEDFIELFDAIQNRTQQVYKSAARNNLGSIIFDKLGAINEIEGTVDEIQDIADFVEGLGEPEVQIKGAQPEMSIYRDGKRVNFKTNKDIQYAVSSANEFLSRIDRSKEARLLQKAMNIRRNVLTEWNPLFVLTNGIKDAQDVLFNSQHAARTYAKFPEAYAQIVKKGYWYEEYLAHGGLNASLFTREGELNKHEADRIRGTRSKVRMAWDGLGDINRVVEMAPRLAEYIASREMGRDIDTAMLDAARVTTNFTAGGDIGKFLNRNVSTFLNANIQGAAQQVRNVRENLARGPRGWANLVVKGVMAQLPAMLINHLRWKDDEDYEKLSDYEKDRYYIIAKYGNGQFLRIPKGRIAATLQKVGSTVYDYASHEKEFTIENAIDDIAEDFAFAVQNIGVENPIDNTLGAPLLQAATDRAWYGGTIVPKRLQGKDISDITDESVSEVFNYLGRAIDNPVTAPLADRLNINPITMQYVAEQYGGGWSNLLLGPTTREAKRNSNPLLNAVESKFSTNSNFKNQDVTDYYDNREKLEKKNKKDSVSVEDKLKYKYVDSFGKDFAELYAQQREIQESNIPNNLKYKQVLEIQKQIDDLAKEVNEGLDTLKISTYKGDTATIGDKMYYKDNEGKWNEIKEEDKPSGISVDKYGKYKNDINALTKEKQEREGKDTASLTDAEKAKYLLNANYTKAEKETIYESIIKKDDTKYDGLKAINPNADINDYLRYKSNSYSKKADIEAYLESSNYSGMEQLYIKGASYKLTKDERSTLIRYLNTLPQNKKDTILDGLSANNGKRDDNGAWQWKD